MKKLTVFALIALLSLSVWMPAKASTTCETFTEEWILIDHANGQQYVLLERGGTIVFQYEDKDGFVDHDGRQEFFVIPDWIVKIRLLDSEKNKAIICHIG